MAEVEVINILQANSEALIVIVRGPNRSGFSISANLKLFCNHEKKKNEKWLQD